MSCSKWAYTPEVCDGEICVGDCDLCDKPKNMEDEDDTTDYTKREDMYCHGIINCKYQDDSGECVFNYLGSGREIDKPCYGITDEQRLNAIEEAIDRLAKNVIALSKIVERIVGQ